MSSLPPWLSAATRRLEAGLRELYGQRFQGLLLFGSYARGEADEGSDVDLLLLLDGPVNAAREILRVQPIKVPIALEAEVTLSIVPVSLEQYERRATSFLRNVAEVARAAA